MDSRKIGRFISYILRHHPEAVGITLDEHGWANVDELIDGISRKYPEFDRAALDEIVATNDKRRYSYSEDKLLIRANQGHSVPVDVELPEALPPQYLFHGTGEKYVPSIDKIGLVPKSRLYVHLSADIETAVKVGRRHGKPFVYRVNAAKMAEDGFKFCLSVNEVWLTKEVPAKYLEKSVTL
jgi:putative RNA 2'-phosphotransferase